MPALNFQKQFVELVRERKKRQTIRLVRKYPIKVGDKLYLYYGMRTKYCKKIADAVCTGINKIEIYESGVRSSFICGDINGLNKFARYDGFENWDQMRDWFNKNHGLPLLNARLIYFDLEPCGKLF